MRLQFDTAGFIILFTGLLMLLGQIQCLYKLCSCDFEPSYKAEIIYSVSLITGVGVVTGYMDFGK